MKTLTPPLATKIVFTLIMVVIFNSAFCQETSRLSYWRYSAFYESGTTKSFDGTTGGIGNALGIEINVNPVYDGIDTGDDFVLGWSLNGTFGFNFTQTTLRPVSLDMGFWGGYLLRDDLEVGLQYCFLGVYGLQEWQFFGSKISPAIKFKNFQATFSRSGDGAIRGCFVPRFDSEAIHSAEIVYYYKQFMIGAKLTGYSDTREYRALFAMNVGE